MRDVTRRMLRVLNSDHFAPVSLVDIRLAGATADSTIRFTDAGEQTTFGGQVYLPVSMARSEMREVMSTDSGDQSSITLTVGNFNTEMAELMNRVELEGARITYYLHDRRLLLDDPSRTRDAMTIAMGEVRNPVLSSSTLILQVVSVLGLLDSFTVPKRSYKSTCNATFGSRSCGADLSDFIFDTTVAAGSTEQFLNLSSTFLDSILGSNDPNDFFINGYVTFASGINTLQSRPIARVQVSSGVRRVYLRYPFLNKPTAGDSIKLVRGCPKTKAGCAERQGDALNFRGFEEIPYTVKPVIINGDA